MSKTVNHEIFGSLEKEVDDDGRIHLSGKTSVGEGEACRLHITGLGETPVEEILQRAATAHAVFVDRERELRQTAVNQVITDQWLQQIADDIGEKVSREEAIDAYSKLLVINYFTDRDEASIYFEDEEGLFGVDVNLVTDLSFTRLTANADG